MVRLSPGVVVLVPAGGVTVLVVGRTAASDLLLPPAVVTHHGGGRGGWRVDKAMLMLLRSTVRRNVGRVWEAVKQVFGSVWTVLYWAVYGCWCRDPVVEL